MIGSSSISSYGFTGDPGPQGPVGATGNTGNDHPSCVGLAKGNTASYISSIVQLITPYEQYGDFIITYSDGATLSLDATVFLGNTLFDASGVTVNDGTNISVLSDFSIEGTLGGGSTANFNFKRLASTIAGWTLNSDNNFIFIDAPVSPYVGSGFATGRVAYFDTTHTIAGATSDMSFTGDNVLYVNIPGTTLTGTSYTNRTSLITNTTIKNMPIMNRGSSGSYLDISEAGLFYINTPNGIMGFTGFPEVPGTTGEIISITLILQNDSIWNFPENVLFRSKENYLTCGENILNLVTSNSGLTWDANFFGKGYDAFPGKCIPSMALGACSSIDGTTCESYVTKEVCDNRSGVFCPSTICADFGVGSGVVGSCCVNGVCKDNVSKFLCEKYGGRHWTENQTEGNGCSVIDCWDPCFPEETSCCDGILCHDRYTKKECDLIGGSFNNTLCDAFSCVPMAHQDGVCCIGGECIPEITFHECNEKSGIFMGIGENCSDLGGVDCSCVESSTICNVEFSRVLGARCLHTYDIILHGIDTTVVNGKITIPLCLKTQSYSIDDRFILVASNNTDPTTKLLYRTDPGTNYLDCPVDADSWTVIVNTNQPILGGSDNTSTPGAIILDSTCKAGQNSYNITINEDQVEMFDKTDPWYKKIRMFVLGACSSMDNSPLTTYNFRFECGACTSAQAQQLVEKEVQVFKTSVSDYTTMRVYDSESNFNSIGII